MKWLQRLITGFAIVMAFANPLLAQDRFIVVASTTSTEQSGLFGHILPLFTAKTGIAVRVVALGTGQALLVASRGDADVVFVHDFDAEQKFLADGFGVDRREVMYNDFVLVGPKADPARTAGNDIAAAFQKLLESKSPFVSRGDNSGTHAAELRLWRMAGIEIDKAKGPWYRETGSGMGPALNTAVGSGAYVLTDRGTWLSFRRPADYAILVEGDRRLFNQYAVMLVNPERHSHVKVADGRAFMNWLLSSDGQTAVASYKVGGEQLFFPNAVAPRS
jgi:tungstate transport system substrate-binding protein